MKSQLAERRRANALSLANAQVDSRGFEIDAGLTFGYMGIVRGLFPISLAVHPVQPFSPTQPPIPFQVSSMLLGQNLVGLVQRQRSAASPP
jgi:hypothetical protein